MSAVGRTKMKRSPLVCALVSVIGAGLWFGPARPGAAECRATPETSRVATNTNPVQVLVLTPMQDQAKRSYGLRVLAGICLALSEPPDDFGYRQHSDQSGLSVGTELCASPRALHAQQRHPAARRR